MIIRTYSGALWHGQSINNQTASKAKAEKRPGHPPTILSEEEVLECRARHEFFGWSLNRCASTYQTTTRYMRQLLDYQVRGKLISKPEHANITAN